MESMAAPSDFGTGAPELEAAIRKVALCGDEAHIVDGKYLLRAFPNFAAEGRMHPGCAGCSWAGWLGWLDRLSGLAGPWADQAVGKPAKSSFRGKTLSWFRGLHTVLRPAKSKLRSWDSKLRWEGPEYGA